MLANFVLDTMAQLEKVLVLVSQAEEGSAFSNILEKLFIRLC